MSLTSYQTAPPCIKGRVNLLRGKLPVNAYLEV